MCVGWLSQRSAFSLGCHYGLTHQFRETAWAKVTMLSCGQAELISASVQGSFTHLDTFCVAFRTFKHQVFPRPSLRNEFVEDPPEFSLGVAAEDGMRFVRRTCHRITSQQTEFDFLQCGSANNRYSCPACAVENSKRRKTT